MLKVHASQGKLTRAEPVAALYEQRKMHHVDPHSEMLKTLEDQMTTFVPGVAAPREDATRRGWTSPDRMDALVWGFHELFLKNEQIVDYSMFTREAVAKLERYLSPHAPIIPPGLRPWWDP